MHYHAARSSLIENHHPCEIQLNHTSMASGGGKTAPSGLLSSTLRDSSASTPAGGSAATAPFSEEQWEWIEKLISSQSPLLSLQQVRHLLVDPQVILTLVSDTHTLSVYTHYKYDIYSLHATSLNTSVAGTWLSARLVVAFVPE